MALLLDWVNVMTYDFHSGGTRAGFNSALYNHDDPSNPKSNTHDAVQAILAKGVPRSKLVAGVPFYGRGWRGVESPNVWSTGTGTIQVGGYQAIVASFLKAPGFVRYWDDVAKVPWLYNADTKEWITLRGPAIDAHQGRVHRRTKAGRRDVLGAVKRRWHTARRAEGRPWPSRADECEIAPGTSLTAFTNRIVKRCRALYDVRRRTHPLCPTFTRSRNAPGFPPRRCRGS